MCQEREDRQPSQLLEDLGKGYGNSSLLNLTERALFLRRKMAAKWKQGLGQDARTPPIHLLSLVNWRLSVKPGGTWSWFLWPQNLCPGAGPSGKGLQPQLEPRFEARE